jgi:hypothetical protein
MASDQYWDEHRGEYDLPGYVEVALRQKEELLRRAAGIDAILEGVTVDSDDPDFLRFSALAREAFPSEGPFARVSLRPDPWKATDAWRIEADGRERYIWTDMVRKHLGEMLP